MTTHPNCKVNLGLNVVRKREDGYHDIETVFVPVDTLCDTLTIEPHHTTVVEQQGIVLDNAPSDNLCMKAYEALNRLCPLPPVIMRLQKGIPFGAGLGGGSSDAAFTLKMLNSMFNLGLSNLQLKHVASTIGADCAFFIDNTTAFATGIGDQLMPFDLNLDDYRIEIEIPDGEHVSTREAYAGLHLSEHCRADLRTLLRQPIEQWRHTVKNDFEPSVMANHPAISQLKAQMYDRGALFASMTGSGAAVFGLFKK